MRAIIQDNLEYRKKEFKRGIDNDITRRKREDDSLSIRKQKREDKLTKKRNFISESEPETNIGTNKRLFESNDSPLDPNLINNIYSNDPDTVLKGLTYLRKKLSIDKVKVISDITKIAIQSNIHQKVVTYLSYVDYPKHQIEASWILTNLVSGKSEDAVAVIESTPLIEYCIKLLYSKNRELIDQVFWCLGNIAGESPKYRDIIVNNGGLHQLCQNLDSEISYEKRDIKKIRNQAWVIGNFIRPKPTPPVSLTHICFPVFKRIFTGIGDTEVLSDAMFCLSYITMIMEKDEMRMFLDNDIITKRTLHFLSNPVNKIVTPFLRTCGNLIAGPDDITQKMLDMGFLNYVPRLLSRSKDIKKETCWIISNITAGNKQQIQQVVDSNIIPSVIILLDNDSWNVKRECVYVLANLVSNGKSEHIKYIVNCGCIDPLCNVMGTTTETDKLILDTFDGILKVGVKKNNNYTDLIEDAGGLDKIEMLQESSSEEVYKKCVDIIDTYFDCPPPLVDIDMDIDQHYDF